MAEQDKANITSNLTADDSNKVQVSKKKPSAKLKSSTVNDIISKSKTMTGSRPDQININPVQESVEKKAVIAFGRFNPPTVGHEKLIHKVEDTAKSQGGQAHIIASHSEGTGNNPVPVKAKTGYLKKIAAKGTHVSSSSSEQPSLLHAAAKLHKQGVEHLTMVAGSDRVSQYHDLLHKYNNVESKHGHYNFKSIKVVSAGHRDPDAEGTTGMSGTKMRSLARSGNTEQFKKGLPKALHPHAEEIANHIKSVKESIEDYDPTETMLMIEQIASLSELSLMGNMLNKTNKTFTRDYQRNIASHQKDDYESKMKKKMKEEINIAFDSNHALASNKQAVVRSGQDRKKLDYTPRDGDRKKDDKFFRQQSIVKRRVDEDAINQLFAEGTTTSDVAVWDKPPPKGKSTKLSSVQKARAKARAKAAGRPYPNLVDNMAVAKEETIHELSNELIGKVNKIRTLMGRKSKTAVASTTLNKAVDKVRSRTDVGKVK